MGNYYTLIDVSNRLRKLRRKNNYSKIDIAKILNVSLDKIRMIEDGFVMPSNKQFKILSKLYKVSDKYLRGLE